jgi:hypothetical protein
MATIKTNYSIACSNIEEARLKVDNISNGIIIVKDDNYLIVNYKTYAQLKTAGYNQVR